jgi:Alkylmercury lyase
MDWDTARVHHELLQGFIEHGHPPRLPDEAHAALRQLEADHGVVLHPGTTEVWIAHPFSASPTGVWVQRRDSPRGWWAPCMWCAMGIVVLAAPDAIIHARFGGEAEVAAIPIEAGARIASDACVHFALPPSAAWNNVVHFCAMVLPFRSPDDVAPWSQRHDLPLGAVVPIATVLELARVWYGRHLARDWRKWTIAEAQEIFRGVGLVGPHWQLPAANQRF